MTTEGIRNTKSTDESRIPLLIVLLVMIAVLSCDAYVTAVTGLAIYIPFPFDLAGVYRTGLGRVG